MSQRRRTALVIVLAATAHPAIAQEPAGESKAAVEPEAISALKAMGAYLRTLKTFQVDVVTTDEDVLEDGQKIQSDGKATLVAQVPGRLFADVENDRHGRVYLYDGRRFTLYAKRPNVYATVDAPATIEKLAHMLDENYGFSVPLEDLFLWGSPGWKPDGITRAMDVGPGVVAGTTCEQYAFRQADVDWQLWLQKGAHPLPRKIVITTRTDEARPQHTAVYTWNLAPSFNEHTFKFEPPQGAGKVVFTKPKPIRSARVGGPK